MPSYFTQICQLWLEKLTILTKELIRTIKAQVDVPIKYHPHQNHQTYYTLKSIVVCMNLYTQMHTHKIMFIARNITTVVYLDKYFISFHGTLKHKTLNTHIWVYMHICSLLCAHSTIRTSLPKCSNKKIRHFIHSILK